MTVAAASLDLPGRARSKPLHVALWIVQALLFVGFAMAGAMKAFAPMEQLTQQIPWVPRVAPALVRFIGAAELAGGLGVLLPSLLRIGPRLTSLAGLGLAAVMLLAAG